MGIGLAGMARKGMVWLGKVRQVRQGGVGFVSARSGMARIGKAGTARWGRVWRGQVRSGKVRQV